MAKVDLQSAYRSVGIKPSEYCLTGIKWQFKGSESYTYLLDSKLPFGARKSPAIFNRITQSIRRMMSRRGYEACVVLLDDFLVAAESLQECAKVLSDLIHLLRGLGFRINWRKVVDPTQDIVFLGVRINSVSGLISLDPNKVLEIIDCIDSIMLRKRISKSQLQTIAGKLSWACTVTIWGRTFLNNIYQAIAKLNNSSHKHPLTCWLIRDFAWWKSALMASVHSRRIWDDRDAVWCYSDSSQNGGGGFCNGFWLYRNWQLDTGFATYHINCKELAMAYLCVQHWAKYLSGKKLIVFLDSTAAVAFINRQRAPSKQAVFIIKQLALLCIKFDISIHAVHIAGKSNEYADAISRLDEPGQFERFWSLIHQYYHPHPPPTYFWLLNHMSHRSIEYLSPQILKSSNHVICSNNSTLRSHSGDRCPWLRPQRLRTELTGTCTSSFVSP